MMRFVLFLAMACLLATSALAQEDGWAYAVDPTNPDEIWVTAFAPDPSKAHALAYQCSSAWGDTYLAIRTRDAWDIAALYPQEVPVTFSIDGTDYSDLIFHYENNEGLISISVDDFEQTESFDTVLVALIAATQPIGVRFLDKDLTFPAAGVTDALNFAFTACAGDPEGEPAPATAPAAPGTTA
jgi:hypothetical protein